MVLWHLHATRDALPFCTDSLKAHHTQTKIQPAVPGLGTVVMANKRKQTQEKKAEGLGVPSTIGILEKGSKEYEMLRIRQGHPTRNV